MKHIKTFELFESSLKEVKAPESNDVWNPREHPRYINRLPWMSEWLEKIQSIYVGEPGQENSEIITPYGVKMMMYMDPDDGSAEYSGDGHWDIVAWGETDDWGISYRLRGYITGVSDPDDLADGEWEWSDEISATIGYLDFDPIKFLEKAIRKEPIVASQLYEVLPTDKRREADELFARLGIDIEKISKGSNLLTSLGS